MISEYMLKCNHCDTAQSIGIDESVPFFNQARKRDWVKLTCQSCGASLLAAKFSKRSNVLFTMNS